MAKKQQPKKIQRTKSIQQVIQESKDFTKNFDQRLKKKDQEEKKQKPVIKKENKIIQKVQKKLSPKLQQQVQKKDSQIKKKQNQQIQQKQQNPKKNNIKKTVSNSSFKNNKFTDQEVPNYINMEQLQEGVHEMDEFHNFKEKFLGKEGAFSAYKILIGYFYNFDYDGGVDGVPGAELKKRGFNYDVERDFDKFTNRIMDYDIVWIIASNQTRNQQQENKFLDQIGKFMKAKKSLFLWSDNTPYHYETNLILNRFFNGMNMQGNFYGDKVISEGKKNENAHFDKDHSIAYGLKNLHEGVTICSPQQTHADFKHFAYNSNNEPLVSYAEENENHGRILLDCGFTKLFKSMWEKAGTHQYVSNANVWLTGIPI